MNSIRGVYALALVNSAIWVIAMVALVFVIQRAPAAKGLFVILTGGTGVLLGMLSMIGRVDRS